MSLRDTMFRRVSDRAYDNLLRDRMKIQDQAGRAEEENLRCRVQNVDIAFANSPLELIS